MFSEFFLIVACVILSLIQGTMLSSLPLPWSALPLTFLVGVIVLHRRGPLSGIMWFVSAGIFIPLLGFNAFSTWQYVLFALIGAFLVVRIITTRSIYALLGLGYAMYGFAGIIYAIPFLFVNKNSIGFLFEDLWPLYLHGLWLLGIGLIFGFFCSRGISELFKSLFIVRKSHGRI